MAEYAKKFTYVSLREVPMTTLNELKNEGLFSIIRCKLSSMKSPCTSGFSSSKNLVTASAFDLPMSFSSRKKLKKKVTSYNTQKTILVFH